MLTRKRIAHLTTVHRWDDARIFHKMCRSLASSGHEVHLIAAHGPATTTTLAEDVSLHRLPEPSGRLERMTRTAWSAYRKALSVDADIYQFHDPELIPVGILLRLRRRVVIYDVHEDMPKRIMDRQWVPFYLRPLAGKLITFLHMISGKMLSAVVCATPSIAQRFNSQPTVIVRNYPSLAAFPAAANDWARRRRMIIFIGTIDPTRGILELVEAFRRLQPSDGTRLVIAGKRHGGAYDAKLDRASEGLAVDFPGHVSHERISTLLGEASVGAITMLSSDVANEAIATKMYEYMAAGIPVVATDMPLWTKVIENAECGSTVDPCDDQQVAKALRYWLEDPVAAERAGKNGRNAIEGRYNWEAEFSTLSDLYQQIAAD